MVRNVVDSLSGRIMMIGVDRLDYSKGLAQRMDAYERFLAVYPDWHGKVTYLQIAPKSRSDIREYVDMERTLSTAAGHINGTYGQAAWTPIRYVNRAYSRSALAGLYRSARVALVTPLRDGMNLVAKEYIAAQNQEDPGVLILSRFAGAAAECQSALLVNPYDPEVVAISIARALSMPLEERRERHEALYRAISDNNINSWGENFLTTLTGASDPPKSSDRCRVSSVGKAVSELRLMAVPATSMTALGPPSLLGEIDDDLDVARPMFECFRPVVDLHPPSDQPGKPGLVGMCECVSRHLVMSSVGVDGTEDRFVVQHHVAVDPADIERHRARLADAEETDNSAGRGSAKDILEHRGSACAFHQDIGT